ncbi:MAG: ATP-binding protein [Proteobacteria bacterium]|nr:ATP-binding protein [Pseudomonadota bacterium]
MRASEINLANMLVFQPDAGKLLLGTQRMLLFSQQSLGTMAALLHAHLGGDYADALFAQFGYRCGGDDFAAIAANGDWDSEVDRLSSGPVTHMWEGIVHVEPTKLDYDRARGHFHMTGIWRNSYEAENYVARFGRAERPVCASLTGYATGWGSAFFERPVLAIETLCQGRGDPHCAFEIRPFEAWGPEAAPWRRALEATDGSIARVLEERIAARTRDLQDVNERLEIARQHAEKATRVKSQFLTNMSHEIRTPMNGVIGLATMLSETSLTPEQRELVDGVVASGRHLVAVINDILDVSKIEAGHLRLACVPLSIRQLLQRTITPIKVVAAAKGVDVRHEIAGDVPDALLGDEVRLGQVLTNLIGNAVKFTPQGSVRVQVEQASASPGHLLFRVVDNGIGVAPEHHEAIFQPFTQADGSTSRQFGGTGLGLTISRDLVRQMGGDIAIESDAGRGSTFTFTIQLPVATAAERASIEPRVVSSAASGPSVQRRRLSILVAEDNDVNAMIACRAIEKRGHVATRVTTGRHELERHAQQPFDLILMDMQMPDLDGVAATRLIREAERTSTERRPAVPILAFTANAMPEHEVECRSAGMNGFLTKPVNFQRLGQALEPYEQATLR